MVNIKIKVSGAYGATNFGDDLLMCLFEKYLIYNIQNVDINFVGQYIKDYPKKMLIKSTFGDDKFEEDWFIYGGGTQFFSFQSHEKRDWIKLLVRICLDPSIVLKKIQYYLKNNSRKNIAFIGFGLGPFNNNLEKIQFVKEKLSSANFVSVRDEISLNYCKEWGIHAYFGADIAYSSYFDYKLPSNLVKNSKKKIGIIVRDWVWDDSGKGYFDPIWNLYKGNTFDYDFQFIVFAPYKDPYWMNKLKNENVLVWNPDKFSIQDFLDLLSSFDAFISARFHGSIIAAILGKPVISIGIEPKLENLILDLEQVSLWKKPFLLTDLEYLIHNINWDVDYKDSLNDLKSRADDSLNVFINSYFI